MARIVKASAKSRIGKGTGPGIQNLLNAEQSEDFYRSWRSPSGNVDEGPARAAHAQLVRESERLAAALRDCQSVLEEANRSTRGDLTTLVLGLGAVTADLIVLTRGLASVRGTKARLASRQLKGYLKLHS